MTKSRKSRISDEQLDMLIARHFGYSSIKKYGGVLRGQHANTPTPGGHVPIPRYSQSLDVTVPLVSFDVRVFIESQLGGTLWRSNIEAKDDPPQLFMLANTPARAVALAFARYIGEVEE